MTISLTVFAVTIGFLFLSENTRLHLQDTNYARIIDGAPGDLSKEESISPSQKLSATPVATIRIVPSTDKASQHSTTQIPAPSMTPTTTPELSMSPTAHIYYTSSYSTAKYYYCDTDSDWKNLSANYLKSYPSESAILKDYPARILHEPCK
ncbi:MAG: hypothetical protein HY506_00790 [Candidatus Yanofskybacteria bacterium]|nr:hypothetical protein [Candidatus Yanofskybacteria bacterium]